MLRSLSRSCDLVSTRRPSCEQPSAGVGLLSGFAALEALCRAKYGSRDRVCKGGEMAGLGTPDQRVISHDSTIDEPPRQRGWSAPSLRLICFLATLFMISETATASLFPGQKFAAGDGPRSVAVADLNGDTIPDLVTANEYSDDVTVLLGNGDGSFQAAVSFAAGDDGPVFRRRR